MENTELIELSYTALSTSIDAFALYLTILFAYLATAYFAGPTLARFQMLSISIIYSIVIGIVIFTHLLASEGLVDITSHTMETDVRPFVYLLSGFMIVAWALSLVFMAQTRRGT